MSSLERVGRWRIGNEIFLGLEEYYPSLFLDVDGEAASCVVVVWLLRSEDVCISLCHTFFM